MPRTDLINNAVETKQPSHVWHGHATEALLLANAQGVITGWSKGAEALFRWNRMEALGRSLSELLLLPQYHGLLIDSIFDCICASATEPAASSLRVEVRRKDGAILDIELLLTPLVLENRIHVSIAVPLHGAHMVQKQNPSQASVFDLSRDAIIVTGTDGRILFWNAGAARMFDYAREQVLGLDCGELLLPGAPQQLAAIRAEALRRGHWEGELSGARRDRARLALLSRWQVQYDSHGRPLRILISNTSIRLWQRCLESAAQDLRQTFASLFGHHPDGVFAFDLEQGLIAVNPAASLLTGYSAEELHTMPLHKLVDKGHQDELRAAFGEVRGGKPQSCEFTCIRKDGSRMDVGATLLPNMLAGRVSGVNIFLKDVSDRKRDERRILYLANHDALTGLPNRNLLQERMQHAIEQARRRNSPLTVLFMDLNRFKLINDSLGHDKGDALLCTLALRLRAALRDVDTVARVGGDEFVVILENTGDAAQVLQVAGGLLALVSEPVAVDDQTLSVSTSIGASIYPKDGQDAAALMKNADLAMYSAKEAGPGVFRFYEPDMKDKAMDRLGRENGLREAIARGELVLHYQPRLDLARNELVGVEALVRWDHPGKGLIYPSHFIELAEETGMIDAIGEWVLQTACAQLKRWRDAGLRPMKVSVNVSPLQLGSDRICNVVARALADADLDPQYLELEITESSLMQDLEASRRTLREFREMGLSLSIDDFGTGYSSLSHLKRLPVDTLKIDKSFVRDLSQDQDDAAIVSATVAMAHSLRLRTVAEGVTSFDQLRFLQDCGCDEIQGYLLCRPLPAAEAEVFFQTCALRGIQHTWAH